MDRLIEVKLLAKGLLDLRCDLRIQLTPRIGAPRREGDHKKRYEADAKHEKSTNQEAADEEVQHGNNLTPFPVPLSKSRRHATLPQRTGMVNIKGYGTPMRSRILIVDGHSALFSWPELALVHARNSASARERIVKILTGLQDSTDWTVAVVFDGKGLKASSETVPGGIAVLYSKSGQTADSIIERLAAKYAQGYDVTIATNDRMERTTTEALGCMSISIDQLRKEIGQAGDELRNTLRRLG